MKTWLISILQGWIKALDPGITFPAERLNYKRSVDAILNQTTTGRASFYAILVSKLTVQDKAILLKILTHGAEKRLTPSRRAKDTTGVSNKD